MKRNRDKLLFIALIMLTAISIVNAETRVEKEELKTLISGNTLEGKWILWDSNYRMYLDPSGEMKRVYGKGTELTNNFDGYWKINKKGKLCFEVNKVACRRVKKRNDGGYNLYNKKGKLKQTIEKIIDGNPYSL